MEMNAIDERERNRALFIKKMKKKMKEDKYNEALYSFFNGDTVGG